jgi:hypothetical protein
VIKVNQLQRSLHRSFVALLAAIALAAPLLAGCEPACGAEDMPCCAHGALLAIAAPCCSAPAQIAQRSPTAARADQDLKAPPTTVAAAPPTTGVHTIGRSSPLPAQPPRDGGAPLFLLHSSFLS